MFDYKLHTGTEKIALQNEKLKTQPQNQTLIGPLLTKSTHQFTVSICRLKDAGQKSFIIRKFKQSSLLLKLEKLFNYTECA